MIESSPINILPGVGAKVSQSFKRLDISTVGDLLRHYPVAYEDFTHEINATNLVPGNVGWMQGTIIDVKSRRSFGRRGLHITEAKFQIDGDIVNLVWFNRFPIKNLPLNKPIRIAGRVEDNLQIRNPMWEVVSSESRFANRLLARYPLTAGLSQTVIRNAISEALKINIKEWLPEKIIEQYGLINLESAIHKIHKPSDYENIELARHRLAFDEMFLLQLAETIHLNKRREVKAFSIRSNQSFINEIIATLPFKLTAEQLKVISEIDTDLARDYPMNRLLQGEVGSGKTIIAALLGASVINAGYQVLYLAPTEVLANQQFETIGKLYKTHSLNVALLTRGKQVTNFNKEGKNTVTQSIKTDEVDLVIGTHAILNENISLSKLAFVIVDEQHRFGVEQRLSALKQNKTTPHLLAMTATPIPRTLQQAYYADLDISTLKNIPTGKRDVVTYLAKSSERSVIEKRLRDHLDKGEQAYVVCPLIDPSDKLAVRAAASEYERLRDGPLKKYSVGYLHGRMKSDEKQQVLNEFKQKKLDVLVATSVVEVGIDVPNATTIIIEGAERFGLAQLHQLRGRVGRAGQRGYCLLFTENASEQALVRLNKFTETTDGFELAKLDLEIRGPGEWFGVKQSGYPDFKIATLADSQILNEAKEAVKVLLEDDSSLKKYPVLSQKVEKLVRVANQS